MRNTLVAISVCSLVLGLSTACARSQKHVLTELEHPGPVDCSNAKSDIRLLRHEKANVAQRMAEGVTAIYPAGLVIGLVTRTETTKLKVATGSYNKAIENRIKEIQEQCGVE